MEIAQLLDLLINHGFFPFLKSDNPQAYPFILALLAISLAIGIAGTVRARIKGQLDLLPLLFVALDFAFLAVIWLTLSGSYEQFATIPPPAAGTSWLFLPAATVYVAGAVLLHSLVALAAGLALILVWITQQLRLPNGSRAAAAFGQTSLIVGTLLMVLNWNVANIPAWFLVVAEYPLALLVAVLSSELLALPLGRYSVRDPDAMRFVERAKGFVRTAAFATGVALIFWSHTEVAAPLILLGMYLQLTLLDNLVAYGFAALRSYRSGDFRVLFIHRYVVTVPIALVVVALGASGLLDGLAWQRPPSPELWLYAGGAAIAFLVLKPLTDLARYLAGVYVPVPSLVEVFAAQVASWFNSASAGQPRLSGPVRPGAKYQPMSEWDTQETQQTRQEDVDRGREELNRIKAIFFDLNYPGGVVIFVGLILYYLVSASGDISQLVGNNLVTIVGGLVAVLAGFLQFVNDEALGATRKVFMLLLYLILIVTGANALLLHLPGPTPATSQTALILSDPASLLTASRTLAQALLLLLALGAVGYLFRVLDTTLRQERLAIQPQEDADLVRLGDQRIGNAYTQTGEAALNSSRNAEKAYRQAIDTNANNAAAWNGLANALSFQLSQRYQVSHHYDPAHYEQAMKAYDQALALEQNNPLYLVNKANALLGRKPAPGYDDYDLILLLSQNAIKILQASDPIRFGRGSFYARASANQQELELERRADICAGIACTKKGEQEQERGNQEVAKDRYEEAIEFYNAAAAIPHVLGMSNVPKAEAFNNKSVPYLNLAAYHNRRGDAVKAKADFEAALEAADRAIRIESNIAAFYINRGDALRGLGREDEAIAAYKRAVERAGDAEPERAALAKAKINELQAAVRTGAGG